MLKNLPAEIHVVIFIIIAYLFMIVGNVTFWAAVMPSIDEATLETINFGHPKFVLSYTLFFQIFTFLLSFMLMLKLTGVRFAQFVYVDKLNLKKVALTGGIFIGGMIVIQFLGVINAYFRDYLPASALASEAASDATNNSLIYESDPVQLIFSLLIVAVLPAICEELVFRGFLLKKMMESGMAKNGAIFFSALIFALIHFQPLKLLPMLFIGCCLGYVYIYFRNIKYAILLHFLVNGSQVLIGYFVEMGYI